jgi:hypothetical protein
MCQWDSGQEVAVLPAHACEAAATRGAVLACALMVEEEHSFCSQLMILFPPVCLDAVSWKSQTRSGTCTHI